MTLPRTVVFGATGNVGRALVRDLAATRGHRLVAVTRRPQAARDLFPAGVELAGFDLDQPVMEGLDALTGLLSGARHVVLATGYDVGMLAQSKAVIDAAAAAGVEHVVHIGAHSAPDTTIVHLGWHRMIEAYLASAGLAWTNLHPTSFMQNLMLLRAISGAPADVLVHYSGDASSSWVDAEDVGLAAAAVLRDPARHAGRTIRLGAQSATMAQVAQVLAEATGRPWRAEARDPDAFVAAATAAGADGVYMRCVASIFRRAAAGGLPDLDETFDDHRALTGQAPTTLEAFVARHRAAFGG